VIAPHGRHPRTRRADVRSGNVCVLCLGNDTTARSSRPVRRVSPPGTRQWQPGTRNRTTSARPHRPSHDSTPIAIRRVRRKRQRLRSNGSIESDPAVSISAQRAHTCAGSLPIESYRYSRLIQARDPNFASWNCIHERSSTSIRRISLAHSAHAGCVSERCPICSLIHRSTAQSHYQPESAFGWPGGDALPC
jgi:hypothetical protein